MEPTATTIATEPIRPYRSRCFQWVPTDSQQLEAAEKAIMEGMVYHQKQIEGLNTFSSVPLTPLDAAAEEEEDGRRLDVTTEDVERSTADTSTSQPNNNNKMKVRPVLIMVHGFAGGSGHWRQNWEALSAQFDVLAIDLPGFARSSRFPDEIHRVNRGDVDSTIQFYEEKLTAWLVAVRPLLVGKHVTLMGHSFGGYLTAQLLAKQLQRDSTPDSATSSSASATKPQNHHPPFEEAAAAAAQAGGNASPSQRVIPKIHHMILADPWGIPVAQEEDLDTSKLPFKFRMFLRIFYAGAPLAVLRVAGPWGPNLLPRVRPDFADRWAPLNPFIFYDYTYHCNAQTPALGEYAFRSLAHGRAFAKRPVLQHIPEVFQSVLGGGGRRADELPHVTVLYGDHTWMNPQAGRALVANLDELYAKHSRSNAVHFGLVESAGHQLNTDNAPMFNELVIKAVKRAVAEIKAFKKKLPISK